MNQKEVKVKGINFPSKGSSTSKASDTELKKEIDEAFQRGRDEELEQLGQTDMTEERIRTPKALGKRVKNVEEKASYYRGILKKAFEMGSIGAMLMMADVTTYPQDERERYAEKVRTELIPPKVKIIRHKEENLKVDNKSLQDLVARSFKEGIEHGLEGSLMVAKRIEEQPKIIEQLKQEGKLKDIG
jgi:hypothetical protein